MASGQPDYTRQVAVTVVDTTDPVTVIADVTSPPLNVTFPSTQDVNVKSDYIAGRTATFEDSSFVTGDSPVIHDVNAALGRNGHDGYIINDGDGDLQGQLRRGDRPQPDSPAAHLGGEPGRHLRPAAEPTAVSPPTRPPALEATGLADSRRALSGSRDRRPSPSPLQLLRARRASCKWIILFQYPIAAP